ncbi:MAG: hypothetical protein FWF59_03295 [Turicibacter sp.]|nr:hypothetical protein [Turicibacter sp.]
MKYANPYLPLWERMPDGEARVFDDPNRPGKKRLYVVGSHDIRRDSYCGPDIRIWSAPTEDLTDWRDEGPVFSYQAPNGLWDIMYAPDLVEVKRRDGSKEYFLYPHSRGPGREALVCSGPTPVGPFTPLNLDESGENTLPGSFIGFDPSVYVEQIDDPTDPDYEIGFRAYVYYGFQNSFAAQLDQNTMWSVRPGTEIIEHFIPSSHSYGNLRDPEGIPYPHLMDDNDRTRFNFFEASSIRKVGNKYVLVFSGYSGPDYGIESTNSSLRYGFGDSPLGPWKAGGVLVDSRGPVPNADGSALETGNTWHNTHGGLEYVDGQWYVFYHRPPRGFGFSRQPMVAPVTISWDEQSVADGGQVVIRAYDPYAENEIWTAKSDAGEYTGAQVTSEGFNAFGLPLFEYYSAGIASYMSRTDSLQDNFDIWDNHMPLTDIQNGDRIGYQHFDFRLADDKTSLSLWLKPQRSKAFAVDIWLDGPWETAPWNGKKIGRLEIGAHTPSDVAKFSVDISKEVAVLSKKHAIFLVAEGGPGALFDLMGLGFESVGHELERPVPPTVRLFADGQELVMPEHPVPSTIENGVMEFGAYELSVELPKGAEKLTQITATVDNPGVSVDIKQATDPFGAATVTCTYNGAVKTYTVKFVEPSGKGEALEYFIVRNNPVYEGAVCQTWNEALEGFNSEDDAVTFTIDVPEAGAYEMEVEHHAAGELAQQLHTINEHQVMATYRTGGWLKSALAEPILFEKGSNVIKIQQKSGTAEMRTIVLRKLLEETA